jgi:chromosome segregation ATPase
VEAAREELVLYQSKLEHFELELDIRTRRIAELERGIADMTSERDASEALRVQIEHQLNDTNIRLVEIETEGSALRQELDDARSSAAEGARSKEAMIELQRGLQAALEERDEALRKLEEAVGTAEELERLRSEVENGHRTVDEFRERVSDVEAEAARSEERAIEAARVLAVERARAEHARREEVELQRRAALAEEEAAAREERILSLTGQLESVENALDRERAEHQSSRCETTDALERLQEATARLEKLERDEGDPGAATDAPDNEQNRLIPSSEPGEQSAKAVLLSQVLAQLAEETAKHAETRRMLSRMVDGSRRSATIEIDGHESSREECFLCFGSVEGSYCLEARTGPTPVVGETIHFKGVEHVTVKIGTSPMPGDPRRCAYLQHVHD